MMWTQPLVAAPISACSGARPRPRARFDRRGFTLIELLVVVAIIAALLAILMPSMGDAVYSANLATCKTRQRQILAAAHVYASDNFGKLPPPIPTLKSGFISNPYYINYHGDDNTGAFPALSTYLGRILPDAEVLICPLVPGRPKDFNKRYHDPKTKFLKGYGIWWNWNGYKNQGWVGPSRIASESSLMITDVLYWTGHGYNELRYNHDRNFPGSVNTENYESFWTRKVPAIADVPPKLTLNAGYTDGRVDLLTFDQTDQKAIDGNSMTTSWYSIPKRR